MCGSVVRLGVMSYLGEMNGFRVPRLLVCNTLGEMNGLGLHVTSVGRIHLSARGPRHMVWKGVRHRLRLVSFRGRALGGQSTQAKTSQDGLPHWPAAVAWWHSRVQLVGQNKRETKRFEQPASFKT